MKYNCLNSNCNNKIKNNNTYCNSCFKKINSLILKSLELYISEGFCFKEAYQISYPFKIVEHNRFKHGVVINGYSNKFLKLIDNNIDEGITFNKISNTIEKLKQEEEKLYKSLFILWGMPVKDFTCHKSTVYRRLRKALIYIAKDIKVINCF
ncbi:MAG: hypothetical protein AB1782_02290 [Cyanobacteriota bacterium]